MSDGKAGTDNAAACPICGKTVEDGTATAPFCSARCRLVDLNRWLGEDYRISRPLEQSDIEEGD